MADRFPVSLAPLLRGRIDRDDGVAMLALAGEFDLAGVDAVRAVLTEVEATTPKRIVVDVRALTFLDSSGVRVLVDGHERAKGNWGFALLDGSGPAHHTLTVMGFDRLFELVSLPHDLEGGTSSGGGGRAE